MIELQPPPKACPACAADNLPFARTCRACGVDLSDGRAALAAGETQTIERRRAGSLTVAVVILVLISISLVGLNLTGVIGGPHESAASSALSASPGPSARVPSTTPSADTPASLPATPGPGGELIPVGQAVTLARAETHAVLRVETWPGLVPAGPGERYLAVEVQVRALPGQTARFDQLYYTVGNAAGVLRNAPQVGRQPALAYGILGPGQSVTGWVSFLVPDPGPFVLNYHYPRGSNGETVNERFALDPILPPSPDPILPSGPGPGASKLPNFGYPTALPSTNYSGYGAQLPGTAISSVTGSWVQPAVRCSGTETSAVATWVGIDDGGVQDLEQIGTEALCHPGSTVPGYIVWYEMYPQPQVAATTIRPGDHFTASVTKHGNDWTLSIRDTSAGGNFTTTQTRDSAAIQALWVVEAPARVLADGELQLISLATFNRITMTGCSAVAGGVRRVVTDRRWAHYRFDMRTTSNTAKAQTSGLTTSGTVFSSTWKHH